MPQFDHYPRRYNSLRLLGYEYNSIYQLCALTLVTELRRPLFADIKLAKSVLTCLLSDTTLDYLRVRAFTLMPDHLHLVAGVRQSEANLGILVGRFKSYTTQVYWARGQEIIKTGEVILPAGEVNKSDEPNARPVLSALFEWRAALRPEVVNLKKWPRIEPAHFLKKRLWQPRFFDHVIRNDDDLRHNLNYIAMNPVHAGYVTHPQFYPYTGFF